MANGNAPDSPGENSQSRGFSDRSEAVDKAREKHGDSDRWEISRRRIDGEQRFVVTERVKRDRSASGTMEVWRDDG